MSLMNAAKLVKDLEEERGVSDAAPVWLMSMAIPLTVADAVDEQTELKLTIS